MFIASFCLFSFRKISKARALFSNGVPKKSRLKNCINKLLPLQNDFGTFAKLHCKQTLIFCVATRSKFTYNDSILALEKANKWPHAGQHLVRYKLTFPLSLLHKAVGFLLC